MRVYSNELRAISSHARREQIERQLRDNLDRAAHYDRENRKLLLSLAKAEVECRAKQEE